MSTSWRSIAPCAAWLGLVSTSASAQGTLSAVEDRIAVGLRVVDERIESVPVLGRIAERRHLSGSAVGVMTDAEDQAFLMPDGDSLWDARLFLDIGLAQDFGRGEQVWVRSVGLSLEWEERRLGRRTCDWGEAYVDLQGLGGGSWWNLRVGRFQLPVGENYLRFGKAYRDNPLMTHTVAGAWWWDEGIRLPGTDETGRYGYVASLTDGGTPRDWHLDFEQLTLKLFVKPLPWLHVSASALWSGERRTVARRDLAEAGRLRADADLRPRRPDPTGQPRDRSDAPSRRGCRDASRAGAAATETCRTASSRPRGCGASRTRLPACTTVAR